MEDPQSAGQMDGWVDGSWMDDGWMEAGWVDDEWMMDDGWRMDGGWMDGWRMDGWMEDGWLDLKGRLVRFRSWKETNGLEGQFGFRSLKESNTSGTSP